MSDNKTGWYVTVRIHLTRFCDHSEPEQVVRELIEDECSVGGFEPIADWPDDYEILSITPDREIASHD